MSESKAPKNKSRQVMTNLLWRLAERFGAKGVELIVSIVLARVLLPEQYGSIALVTVVINILQVFVDGGLGNALIQKKNADQVDFSTVFFFNIAFCAAIYSLLFLASPLIADFYSDPELTPVIRVLGLTVLISGVKNVQHAYVSRHMMFHRFFYATLGGTIGAAVIGIWMAYHGYGIWALVAQQIFNVTLDTVILWFTVRWRPTHDFSWQRLKGLYSYGWKILVSRLIDTIYQDIRQLIIGKKYSKSDLAYYNRAKQFPMFITSNINTSINSVLFPAMSSVQDERERVKAMTRRSIRVSTYIMAPLMMGLAACGKPIVQILLTNKWLPCVPYLTIFCITYMFQPLHTANLNAIKAMGRSDLFLKLEIIKKVIGIIALVISMQFGVMAMAYSLLITNVIGQVINSWPNKKLLNYAYPEQLMDILPNILTAAGMGLIVYAVEGFGLNKWATLLIQVPLGVVIYIAASKINRLDSFDYLLSMIRKFLHRGKGKKSAKKETAE
ncbi:MAG: lipopolysaccharide biosynthesis protein [Clostridia bacterium]|nr:lipopolysaccharide biosynthesis protein [Clostridia bacterium]